MLRIICSIFLFVVLVAADHKYQSGGFANKLRELEKKYLPDTGRHKRHEVYHRVAAVKDRILKNFDGGESKKSQLHNTKRANYHRDERRKSK